MKLSKWKPWNWFKQEEEEKETRPMRLPRTNVGEGFPVRQLWREMDKVFENFFEGFGSLPDLKHDFTTLSMPRLDISEGEDSYTVEVDIPGISPEEIDITVKDDVLRIRGERRKEQASDDKQDHRVERYYGLFERILSLPSDADQNSIKADFKNGVLRLDIEKLESSPQQVEGRKIPVGVS